jgi:hypothetical protein
MTDDDGFTTGVDIVSRLCALEGLVLSEKRLVSFSLGRGGGGLVFFLVVLIFLLLWRRTTGGDGERGR